MNKTQPQTNRMLGALVLHLVAVTTFGFIHSVPSITKSRNRLNVLVDSRRGKSPSPFRSDQGGLQSILSTSLYSVPNENNGIVENTKISLLSLAASYDRGYGATASVRAKVQECIDTLRDAVQFDEDPGEGIDGNFGETPNPPLRGIWRMVWTTAPDVLLLNASPLFTVGAIYQDISNPPVITNIIDFIPRVQALIPLSLGFPETRIRAEVRTRADRKRDELGRVGLTFEAVEARAVEFVGLDIGMLPPIAFDLPKLPGTDSSSGPGFFDINYVDDDMLIIDQNAPGGLFVLIRVSSSDDL